MNHVLKAGARQIDLSAPVCMGILNVTPDSFSDGGQLGAYHAAAFRVDVGKALLRAEKMVEQGAVFIDVGGESTRPGAREVDTEEEMDRVIPVVEALHRNLDVCVSVDTSSPGLMQEAINAGAELINDVRALRRPGAMELMRDCRAAVCLMHMQGEPRTMQQACRYQDVVTDVLEFLGQRVTACVETGIERERLLVDPGFGFGKSLQQNYRLLKALPRFAELELPVLVGISRKSMIGAVVARPPSQCLAGSIAATVHALDGGARVIRTHDVCAAVDAIRVNCAFEDA